MKNGKLIIASVAVVAVLVIAATAYVMLGGDEEKGPVSLIDAQDREVTIESSSRVASTNATVTEIMCGLGAIDQLAGATSDTGIYDTNEKVMGLPDDGFPGEVVKRMGSKKITDLGNMWHISAESILKCNPDLVIMGGYGNDENTVKDLEALGIPVVVSRNDNSLEDIYYNIELAGKALGKDAEAKAMVNQMKSAIGKVLDWTKKWSGEKPRVGTFMGIGSEWGTYANGDKYLPGTPMITALGGVNVFSGTISEMYAQISKEAIINANPAIMIDISASDPSAITSLKTDPVLKDVDAVKNNKVFGCFNGANNAVTITTQGFVNSYAIMAMCMYQSHLGFAIDNMLDDGNYPGYLDKFWTLINA
ncbi:MAG: ABC transporter substrate-binding protein [Candidatus Methanoplasma sp.]|jgi:iron complex transport system substrate-binding protein|nr:ABC transporter substrate-binding protein [Candidatus Methanoplasma sp.]